MTSENGAIIGLSQIFGTAPRSAAFNVLLMGDGFKAGEQQHAFDEACEIFRTTLLTAAPFDRLADKINIFRLNVASLESGAGDMGYLMTRRTYFEATFDSGSNRLLICNDTLVHTTAAHQLPEYTVPIVVVNTPSYAGSGGPVAVYSLAPDAELIALHDIGHSAFGLADEYGAPAGSFEQISNRPAAGEPHEPNVTVQTDPARLKWIGAVKTSPIPMLANADCSQENRWDTLPFGTVGLFEGAHHAYCGVYRPQFDCRMRSLDQPFCVVCQQVIVDHFAAYGA
jgi:hypothetical protein